MDLPHRVISYKKLLYQELCYTQGLYVLRFNNNNNNERISRAPFHVKHAQLRWAGANAKI